MRTASLFLLVVVFISGTRAFAQDPSTAPKEAQLQHFDASAADKSVDPCTDFYAYACNKWMAANPIPPDRGSFGRGSQLALRNQYGRR